MISENGIGAWILGAPVQGPWPDDSWEGWWATSRHITRPSGLGWIAGGTEFRFVIEGIHVALEQATAAAGGRDIRLDGAYSLFGSIFALT